MSSCLFCDDSGGEILLQDDTLRVVLADEPDFPGFLRVVLNRHVREMTDLEPNEMGRVMDAVWMAERAVREVMSPDKINLASLGNVVPHVHWHVIPRFVDDPCFPDPIWVPHRRPSSRPTPLGLANQLRDTLRRLTAR